MKNLEKIKVFTFFTLLSILFFLGCSKDDNNNSDGPTNNGASTININGVNREYILYVPSAYDGNSSVPLMLNFHGYSDNASSHMENSSDMRSLAESENFILIYSQGAQFEGVTHWNIGSWTEGSTSDDLGFVDELINDISTNYNIDLERVYACGYSNGGFFSQELACNLSNKIAAIGTVAANMSTRTRDNCNPSHPTPIITISGTNDDVVTYDGTDPEGQISHDAVLNYWVSYNQTDVSPILTDIPNINTTDGSTVKLYQYKNGNNNVEIEHYKVINGGHVWPGTYGNMDINANSIIWNFVSQFDINGKI